MLWLKKKPLISMIVVVFNMEREAKRTLYSLSAKYQQDVTGDDYEVIVVDNGSKPPLGEALVKSFGKNFQYLYIENATPSPVKAINFAANLARGEILGIMIDGARMVTPGVLKYAKIVSKAVKNPIITAFDWHLGPDIQPVSILNGYDKAKEDALLEGINWQNNGYKLFEVSSKTGICNEGWFGHIPESNCLFLSKTTFMSIGGYDARFSMPGGGHANFDFYFRSCSVPGTELFYILGEGTFHQIHGGTATSSTGESRKKLLKGFDADHIKISGRPRSKPNKSPRFVGHIPREAIWYLAYSALELQKRQQPAQ